MEGSGGHTKECKVRTTTSANPPVLAAAPSIPCFIRPHPRQPALPPPLPPPPPPPLPPLSPTNHRIYLLLHRYRSPLPEVTTHYRTRRWVLSSPSLNCFPSPVFPSFPLPPRSHSRACSLHRTVVLPPRCLASSVLSNVPGQTSCPLVAPRRDHLKRPNDAERVFSPFALADGGRHSSRIHEWSLVGRRIPRLPARSSMRPFDIKGGPLATLCISSVEAV